MKKSLYALVTASMLLCSNAYTGGYSSGNYERNQRDMKIVAGIALGASFALGVGTTLVVLKIFKKI